MAQEAAAEKLLAARNPADVADVMVAAGHPEAVHGRSLWELSGRELAALYPGGACELLSLMSDTDGSVES
ncbi:hypothetical protein KV112_04415 [Mycolicibacter sp. MYC123]|uniref:Uncharacterized protein n=1 Tax=[Mycobacterium] zoologicum TaxID=2872311 RepID=A0ABU5YG13_9MYCO|nr:hypothetical protein [Mycolicibacter sp. MYC123]MEB3048992.1 hypothetical protein [Mycolicibacter sp. MYC123]